MKVMNHNNLVDDDDYKLKSAETITIIPNQRKQIEDHWRPKQSHGQYKEEDKEEEVVKQIRNQHKKIR